jgi:hypothetical protein
MSYIALTSTFLNKTKLKFKPQFVESLNVTHVEMQKATSVELVLPPHKN